MAILNTPMLSSIVSLAQYEIAFNFLKAIEDLAKKNKEVGCELPRFVDYSKPELLHNESTLARLFFYDWIGRIEELLDPEQEIGVVYNALINYGIRVTMITLDVEVLRLVIESAAADCSTHRVEFESREERFAVHGLDWMRIVEIEQVMIEATVPHYLDEEELGRTIFDAEVKKLVCDALTTLVMSV